MSDAEILMSKTDGGSEVPEVTKSNQNGTTESAPSNDADNAAAPATNDQITEKKNTELATAPSIENQNATEPVKEINVESAPKVVADNAAVIEVKAAAESPVEDSTLKMPASQENEQSQKISEIQQLESAGAGDTCLSIKLNENDTLKSETNGVDKKTPEEIVVSPVGDQTSPPSKEKIVVDTVGTNGNELTVSKLKQVVQKTKEERDSYKKKLENTEKKLAALQASYDGLMKGGGDEIMLRRMVEQLRGKLVQTSLQLEDRVRISTNQEKQINALNSQVASLKEVEALTRSLLQIRNMEVKHLQAEVDDMEVRINEERERYNTMINKMDAAVKLNADLKKEYETQLCLFRDLREKYEEKVTLLSEEKQALETSMQNVSK